MFEGWNWMTFVIALLALFTVFFSVSMIVSRPLWAPASGQRMGRAEQVAQAGGQDRIAEKVEDSTRQLREEMADLRTRLVEIERMLKEVG